MAESTLNGELFTEAATEVLEALAPESAPVVRAWHPWLRQTVSFVVILLLLAVVWEGLKFIGGDHWHFATSEGAWVNLDWQPPLSIYVASDLNLPHVWDIVAAFVNPARRNGPPLLGVLLAAAAFTMQEAVVGFLIGALLGLFLGIVFVHSPLLERGLVPYVVASQTIPILAIAPMVVVWLQAGWWSVAIIAAYLTFFPVTINTLRGLRSPDPRALELMKSYAASRWTILWKLRFPAALPYIFTALKISATTSVVGAIIGELPSGISSGLGGAILNFAQYYVSGPPKLWATIVLSALVGILFFLVVVVAENITLRNVVREM
jgi:NitT/TauT family transport system permease protein